MWGKLSGMAGGAKPKGAHPSEEGSEEEGGGLSADVIQEEAIDPGGDSDTED